MGTRLFPIAFDLHTLTSITDSLIHLFYMGSNILRDKKFHTSSIIYYGSIETVCKLVSRCHKGQYSHVCRDIICTPNQDV